MSDSLPSDDDRQAERAKYVEQYRVAPLYKMGGLRKVDALDELRQAWRAGCRSYLDIGCGRGEMLEAAEKKGFELVRGYEIVPQLCDGDRVIERGVHELEQTPAGAFDLVTSFDVIEHLHPGDDVLLLENMARIARTCVALTANNNPSVSKKTGANLHINIRSYADWHKLICAAFEPDFSVTWLAEKRYVSETWRMVRKA